MRHESVPIATLMGTARTTLAIAVVITLLPATPIAAETFYDQARVLDAQPVYEARTVPIQVQQCGYEKPATPAPVDSAMLGDAKITDPGIGLLGALQRDVELRELPAEVYRCHQVTRTESRNELAGYRVRYEYEGRVYERRMTEPPGDTIRVSVQLSAGRPAPRRLR